jgi:branched-chain amino acid transport system ATP-binding protein
MADAASPLLCTRGLSMTFAGFRALDDVSIKVSEGRTHAIIGPNGAGKTTLFNLLSGFLRPSAGSIEFNGRDITRLGAADIARMGIVRSFQITSIFPHLSVIDNVQVALLSKTSLAPRFWVPGSASAALEAPALAILERVRLASDARGLAALLPYGKKRALELAIAVALDPVLLLLDEPTSGLGGEDVDAVVELVRETARGRTVVLVEHNMNVVEQLSDHIIVLQFGRVIAEGPYQTVRNDQRVIDAYLGGIDA